LVLLASSDAEKHL